MNRLLPASVLLGAAVLAPLPAYAADATCSVDASNVTVTFAAGGSNWLGQTLTGELSVDPDSLTPLDCEGTSIGTADKVITVSAGGATSQWTFDVAGIWNAQVTIENVGADTVRVQGYEAEDYWVTPVGADLDLAIGASETTLLVLDTTPALTTFDSGDNSDFLNLSNWSGPTTFLPGEGSDELTGSAGADTVHVLPDEGADIFAGGAGVDTLSLAEAEDDVTYDADETVDDGAADETDDYQGFENLIGGHGNDRLVGGPDGGALSGGPGNDYLVGGAGDDVLAGDAGFDTLSFEAGGGVTVVGAAATGQGTDTLDAITEGLVGSPARDLFTVSSGIAVVRPGQGNDDLFASAEGVRLVAEPTPDGLDTFLAPAGTWDYSLRTSPVEVTVDGTGGAPGEGDVVTLRHVIGGKAADALFGAAGADVLEGGPGKDIVNGLGGADQVSGGAGDDLVGGGASDDVVHGGDGNDQVLGGEQNDLVRGGTGSDFLDGGTQNDTVYGDSGNDVFDERNVVNGSDALYGGTGLDKARYVKRNQPLHLSNDGKYNDGQAGEADSIGTDIEWLVGGKKNDSIKGGRHADRLEGGEGDDSLNGWNGNDSLVGGTGEDLLRGGAGKDRLHSKDKSRDEVYGGKGSDRSRHDRLDLVAQVEGTF